MTTNKQTAHGKFVDELGLGRVHPMRTLESLGGRERLNRMSPEARALMIGLAKKASKHGKA